MKKKLIIVLVTVCSIVAISACGKKEKVDTKTVSGEENSREMLSSEDETTTEEETATEEMTTEETTTEVPTTETPTTTEAPTTTKVKETTTAKQQNNLDEIAAALNRRYYIDWAPPAGFVSSDGMIYVTEDYPDKTSNITFQYMFQSGLTTNMFGQSEKFYLDFDGLQYKWYLQQELSDIYGFWIEIDITTDDMLTIKNGDCRKICMDYYIGDIFIKQTQYIYVFNNNKDIFFITYSSVGDEGYETVFEKNAKEINIISRDEDRNPFSWEALTF